MKQKSTIKRIIQHREASGLVRQPMIAMLFLLGTLFILAIIALFFIAGRQNAHEDEHFRLLMGKAIENRQEIMHSHTLDNADWGEAYENLHLTINTEWAWDNQNLGASLYQTFHYEGIFVISPDGQTRYSVINGQLHLQLVESWLGTDPVPRLKAMLATGGEKAVSTLVVSEGQVTLLSAAWISPGGDSSVISDSGPRSLMIFADRLTPEKVNKMALEYGIRGAHILSPQVPTDPAASNRLILPAAGGPVSIAWQSDNPGEALLTGLLPALVLLMLATLFIAFVLMKNALRKARMSDEARFLLEQSQQALHSSECRFRDVAETTTDWIWEADENLRFTWISERFPAITGYHISDWMGRPASEFLLNDSNAVAHLADLCQSGGRITLPNSRYLSAQQHQRYCNMIVKRVLLPGGKTGFRGTATDVTQEVKAQERVRYLSHFDDLTGLPNRVQMKEFLEGKLNSEPTGGGQLAIIMVDLDRFKPVNDVYGHSAGDTVLHEVSSRLRRCLQASGMVTRHGGDEFIIILPEVKHNDDIEQLCRQIIQDINAPFLVGGSEIFIGASLGIALAPQDARAAGDLLRYADIALYKAKNEGRNQWAFFQRDMGEKIVQRREMEQELREGIRSGQLRLVYQPRYSTKSCRITGVEALVRWQHPHHGLLMPDQFIPLAEETGLIYALSDWVLETACAETRYHLPGLSVSVNLSAGEFQDKGLYNRIKEALEKTGLESSRLEIEVTENVTLQDPVKTQQIMLKIKALGVKFLIDDFGTGFSSLSYLRTFPFDGIKLDKSFIFPMEDSARARQIVENMVGLGKAYALDVTAEGVETQSQLEQLTLLQCDSLQGYFIGQPVAIERLKDSAFWRS
ncbi:bifunctional diguanylate cyclase/phosphodiesterase [Erwinia persicina]|uniref:bifunctional diguanylate cyclase/phosphodiesterase n=1 Tax=Erwinia persicina TaxID=55211 RepID=UPI00237C07B3|nr:EAL domain-containing protein [Erwinia persicina]